MLLVPLIWDRWDLVRLLLASAVPVAVVAELVRLSVPRVSATLAGWVPVFRPAERVRPSGALWLAVGYAAAAGMPAPAPAAGILIGALADPAASLVGSALGRRAPKSWPGTGAALLTAGLIMVALGYSMAAALVCALVTAAVERWARGMDDNLVLAPAATLCAALFP